MEPISSNSSTTLIQPKVSTEKQARDDAQTETSNATQPAASADRFSSSNPVSELQLQRSQVVTDLGRAQQSGLEATQPFPQSESGSSINRDEAQALSQQVQQQIGANPDDALNAQASQASRQTTLTLFQ